MANVMSAEGITGGLKQNDRSKSWVVRVGEALRHLDDRILLNRNPLARLTYVRELAKKKYKDQYHPRGIALRETLIFCIDNIVSDMGNERGLSRPCQYLLLTRKGFSCKQISKEFGLSREHVSRVYRRRALELLSDRLRSLSKNKPQHLSQPKP